MSPETVAPAGTSGKLKWSVLVWQVWADTVTVWPGTPVTAETSTHGRPWEQVELSNGPASVSVKTAKMDVAVAVTSLTVTTNPHGANVSFITTTGTVLLPVTWNANRPDSCLTKHDVLGNEHCEQQPVPMRLDALVMATGSCGSDTLLVRNGTDFTAATGQPP